MMKIEFDFSNIAKSDGLAVSVTGMAIVFVGLVLVSLFIAGLPGFLDWLDGVRAKRKAVEQRTVVAEESSNEVDESEVAVAIAMVLQHAMTPEDGSAYQRLTIRRSSEDWKWKQASMLHTLSTQVSMRKVKR